jgi:hypothetical protein
MGLSGAGTGSELAGYLTGVEQSHFCDYWPTAQLQFVEGGSAAGLLRGRWDAGRNVLRHLSE